MTTAEQAARTATEELAESQRRYDETRAQIDASQSALLAQVIDLAYQLGRAEGRADALQERIAEMVAKHARETP